MSDRTESPSVAELIQDLVQDVRTLVHQEITLAKLEIQQQIARARAGAIALAIAGATLLLAMLLLVHALSRAVADWLLWPVWAGYGITGLVLALLGGAMAFVGVGRLRTVQPIPPLTAETLKENVEWIRHKSATK